jgi:hypothetical protein
VGRLSIPELVAVDLVPPTVDWNSSVAAKDRLDAHWSINQPYDELTTLDLPLVEASLGAISTRAPGISRVLLLASQIAYDIDTQMSIPAVVERLQRYIDMSATATGASLPAELPEAPPFPQNALDGTVPIRSWMQDVRTWQDGRRQVPPRRVDDPMVTRAWDRWARNLMKYFDGTSPIIEYEDLLLAVAGQPPATFFQRDVGRLRVQDWTDLCLFATKDTLQAESNSRSAWAIIAALRALKFDRNVLIGLARELASSTSADAARLTLSLAEGAGQAPPGLLVIEDPTVSLGTPTERPCLLVSETQLTEHDAALKWLSGRGVYETYFFEREEGDAAREVQA